MAACSQVDCTKEVELCREHHITGFPSIRVFRKGSDDITVHGIHEHESYRGAAELDDVVSSVSHRTVRSDTEHWPAAQKCRRDTPDARFRVRTCGRWLCR